MDIVKNEAWIHYQRCQNLTQQAWLKQIVNTTIDSSIILMAIFSGEAFLLHKMYVWFLTCNFENE